MNNTLTGERTPPDHVKADGIGLRYRGPAWLVAVAILSLVVITATVLALVMVVTGWASPQEALEFVELFRPVG